MFVNLFYDRQVRGDVFFLYSDGAVKRTCKTRRGYVMKCVCGVCVCCRCYFYLYIPNGIGARL